MQGLVVTAQQFGQRRSGQHMLGRSASWLGSQARCSALRARSAYHMGVAVGRAWRGTNGGLIGPAIEVICTFNNLIKSDTYA
jgi:hypothetical protein